MIKHVHIFCSMFWMDKTNNSMISTVPVMVPNIENAPSTYPAGRRCASVWWIVIGAFSEHTWSDCIFIGTLNTSCVCMMLIDLTVVVHILFVDFTRNQCVFLCFPINSGPWSAKLLLGARQLRTGEDVAVLGSKWTAEGQKRVASQTAGQQASKSESDSNVESWPEIPVISSNKTPFIDLYSPICNKL